MSASERGDAMRAGPWGGHVLIDTKVSFCRICAGGCGMLIGVDADDRIVSVRGDPDSPLSQGYACFKGLQAEESHHGPHRLLRPLKRQPDGSFAEISSEAAITEIAARLADLIDADGPEATAMFSGNGSIFDAAAYAMQRPFLVALGSDQFFSTQTIDQSAKMVSFGRLGAWRPGLPSFDDMDIALLFGANPLVSHSALGFLQNDPVRRLKQARARGLKLIVVDPRRTETARNADLVLQPWPGQDAAIAGGILRLILDEGWEDTAFCDAYVGKERIDALRFAIDPLTPDRVEAQAGLEAGQLRAVAELFARDSARGCATTCTGPSMAPFSNLAQHLVDCINVVCGRFLREGEPVHQFAAQAPRRPVHAEVVAPRRGWERDGPSRIRGARLLYGERPSGTLADEILTPGKGRIRALFVDGGDPLTSLPGQHKARRAMAALDLLVVIDPWLSPTARVAHYVLPPYMQYERPDLSMTVGAPMWPGTWVQHTDPVVAPPAGADLVHDWYVFWRIAQRLGRTIELNGAPLDMTTPPSAEDLLRLIMRDSPASYDDVVRHPHGLHIGTGGATVLAARPDASARFDPMPPDVLAELEAFLATDTRPTPSTHLLVPRRMRDLFNGNGRFLRTVRKRTPFNPAYLHPDDLAALGLAAGDRVEIESAVGRVTAIVAPDANLRPGVVSMAHGWGGVAEADGDPVAEGTGVNLLIDTDIHFEAINAMPHMSAVPVALRKCGLVHTEDRLLPEAQATA